MEPGNIIKKRGLRLFAITLIVIGLAALLTELDILLWTQLWLVPPLIALYVGTEFLIASFSAKKRRRSRVDKKS